MRINLLITGLAAVLGLSAIAALAAPQTGKTARAQASVPAQKAIRNSKAQRLQVPAQGPIRIQPRVVRRGRKPGSSKAQTPANNPLAVVVNGQTVSAQLMSQSASFIPAPGTGIWYNLSIFVPATQQEELFILGIPNTPASVDSPLLVGMRQSDVSHGDIINHTTFWDECLARGWYLLAPLSRGIAGYDTRGGASINAQLNTEAALKWVTDHYPIEASRIYGVGFSGGGSLVGSYAARHLDPRDPMFAAIVYHTGSSDPVDSYNSSTVAGKNDIEALMGGTPTTIGFEYRRIGSVELDLSQQWVSGGVHGALNLGSIPTQVWYASNDGQSGLVQQNDQLFDWMNLNGSGPISLVTGVSADPTASFHNWDVLDETQVCDWFDLQTLTPPVHGDLLIDQDARYHYFDVQQEATGAFSRLSFTTTLGNNELALTQTNNVQSISLSPTDLGLFTVSGVVLTLDLESLDSGDEVVLSDLDSVPLSVARDGLPSANWTYSASEETLTISESETGLHVWTVQF
ncbi:MAG: hypothetical protein ACI9X4_002523 [Glaciecola sp.]|jgi:hypothetical protein